MSYRPKHFALNELVPTDVIASIGKSAQIWQGVEIKVPHSILKKRDCVTPKYCLLLTYEP